MNTLYSSSPADSVTTESSKWWEKKDLNETVNFNPSTVNARIRSLPDYIPDERDYLIRPGEMNSILEMRSGLTFQTSEAEKYFSARRSDFYKAYYGYIAGLNFSVKK